MPNISTASVAVVLSLLIAGCGSDARNDRSGAGTVVRPSDDEVMDAQQLIDYVTGTGMECGKASKEDALHWDCKAASGDEEYGLVVEAGPDLSVKHLSATAVDRGGKPIDGAARRYFSVLANSLLEPEESKDDIGVEDTLEWLDENIDQWATIYVSDQGSVSLNEQSPPKDRRLLTIELGKRAGTYP